MTGHSHSLGSVAPHNAQNQMQTSSLPAQGAGQKQMSQWVMTPAHHQSGLLNQATSERNQAYLENVTIAGKVLDVNTQLRAEIAGLQQQLSDKPSLSRDALTAFTDRMEVIIQQHGEFAQENVQFHKFGERASTVTKEALAKLKELEADLASSEQKLETSETAKKGLEEILQQFTTQLGENEKSIKELKAQLSTANTKATSFELTARRQESANQGLTSENQKLTRYAHDMQGQISDLKTSNARLTTENQSNEGLIKGLKEARSRDEATLGGVLADLTKAKSDNAGLQLEVATHRSALGQAQNEAGKLKLSLEQSEKTLEATLLKVDSLTTQVNKLGIERDVKQTQIEDLKSRLQEMTSENEGNVRLFTRAQGALKKLMDERQAIDIELGRTESELNTAKTNAGISSERMTRLSGQLEAKDARISDLVQKLRLSESALAEQTLATSEQKRVAEKLSADLESTKGLLGRERETHASVQDQLTQEERFSQKLNRENGQLKRDYQAIKGQLAHQEKAHHDELQQLHENHHTETTQLKTQITRHTAILEQVRSEKTTLERHVRELEGGADKRELDALKGDLSVKDASIRELQGQISDLKQDLQAKEVEHEQTVKGMERQFAESMGQARQESEGLERSLHEKDIELQQSAQTIREQGMIITGHQQASSEALQQLKELNTRANDLAIEVTNFQEEVQMNSENGAKIQRQIDQVVSKLKERIQMDQSLQTLLTDMEEVQGTFENYDTGNGQQASRYASLESKAKILARDTSAALSMSSTAGREDVLVEKEVVTTRREEVTVTQQQSFGRSEHTTEPHMTQTYYGAARTPELDPARLRVVMDKDSPDLEQHKPGMSLRAGGDLGHQVENMGTDTEEEVRDIMGTTRTGTFDHELQELMGVRTSPTESILGDTRPGGQQAFSLIGKQPQLPK
ncbi:hypothetical protein [Endozoicomonas elysicola]|nr:hypothetical protein [Endozoicomonas elysicola]